MKNKLKERFLPSWLNERDCSNQYRSYYKLSAVSYYGQAPRHSLVQKLVRIEGCGSFGNLKVVNA